MAHIDFTYSVQQLQSGAVALRCTTSNPVSPLTQPEVFAIQIFPAAATTQQPSCRYSNVCNMYQMQAYGTSPQTQDKYFRTNSIQLILPSKQIAMLIVNTIKGDIKRLIQQYLTQQVAPAESTTEPL